jgi:hypothetical protein
VATEQARAKFRLLALPILVAVAVVERFTLAATREIWERQAVQESSSFVI